MKYKAIKKILTELVVIIICLFFSIYNTYKGSETGIINTLDHKFPTYFYPLLMNQLYSWNDGIYLGFNQTTSLTINLPYTALFTLIEAVVKDIELVNRLEYILPIFFAIYFTYLFLTSLFRFQLNFQQKLILILPSSFLVTNILSTSLLFTGLSQVIFAFNFIPLLLYAVIKYLCSKKKIYFALIIPSLIFIGSYNYPYTIVALAICILVIMNIRLINLKSRALFSFFIVFFWALINSYWLLPFGYSLFVSPSFNIQDAVSDNDQISYVFKLVSERYSVDNLLKLHPNYNLISIRNGDNSLFLSYFNHYLVTFLSSIPSLLIIFYLLKKPKDEESVIDIKSLIVIFFVILFFSKGISKPFEEINQYFFDNSLIFKMFRDPLKILYINFFIITIFSSTLLISKKNYLVKILITIFFIVHLIPWVYGGAFGRIKSYELPNYYLDFYNYYKDNKNNVNKRALILDFDAYYFKYIFDKNELPSSNIIKFLSPIPIVDLFSNGGGPSYNYLKGAYKDLEFNDTDLTILKNMGVTHLYKQNDLNKSKRVFYSDKYFNKKSFGKIDIYELKLEQLTPLIYTNNENITLHYKKISPIEYDILLQETGNFNNFKVNFLYTLDNNWVVLPYVNKSIKNCVTYKQYVKAEGRGQTNECEVLEESYMSSFFRNLTFWQKNSFFKNNTELYKNYGATINLNKDILKSNNMYVENLAGFKLFYYPQILMNIGMIISFTTIIFIFGFILIPRSVKNKHVF